MKPDHERSSAKRAKSTPWHLRDLPLLQGMLLKRVSVVLSPLTRPGVMIILAVASIAAVLVSAEGLIGVWRRADVAARLTALVLCGVGLILHEVGHAAAAARVGRQPKTIGVTLLYGFVPACFVDLAPAPASLSKSDRLALELAGSVFQLLMGAVYLTVTIQYDSPAFALAGVLSILLAAWQLLPLPDHDGAHVVQILRER